MSSSIGWYWYLLTSDMIIGFLLPIFESYSAQGDGILFLLVRF